MLSSSNEFTTFHLDPNLEIDNKVAIAWLLAWSPAGPWSLGAVDPANEVKLFPATYIKTIDELRSYVSRYNGKWNLYFSPNATASNITTTPRKDQIIAMRALFVDLDLPKTGDRSSPTEENFSILLRKLEMIDPAPTSIVMTGGGFQAFWIFPEPLSPQDHGDRMESIGQKLGRELESDAVQNRNRWMRLPGTLNIPNKTKIERGRVPLVARVVSADWDRCWDPLVDPVPTLQDEYANFQDEDDPYADAAATVAAGAPAGARRGLAELPVKWANLVRSGDAKDYGGDRSALVMAFCCVAVRRAWSDEEIIPFLTDSNFGISKHVFDQSNPRSYASRQITRARALVSASWDYNARNSIDPSSPHNVARAMNEMGIKLSYNTFSDRYYVNGVGPMRELDDAVESQLRVAMYENFRFYPRENVQKDVVVTEARKNEFHPVVSYLDSLRHDGRSRIDTWLIDYGGAEDTPYVRAVSRLILLAAVRRVRHPGTEFHQMLVLVSPQQGTGKSSAIKALCPDPSWFTDSLPLKVTDQKAIEHLSGKWIVECSELQGMTNSDVETVKAFLSRSYDRARLAWGRNPTTYARRCVFFGSTNAETFLRDTQNRRFWPVWIRRFDIAALAAKRDLLWAEASALEAIPNTSIELPEELWPDAAAAQEEARYGDPWVDALHHHVAHIDSGRIAVAAIWNLLGIPIERRSPLLAGRIGEVMRELGWESSARRFKVPDGSEKKMAKCYIKGDTWPEYAAYRDPSAFDAPWELRPAAEPPLPNAWEPASAYEQRPTSKIDPEIPF
jgi:Virulence-associated protein E